jgi:hypothetical protein
MPSNVRKKFELWGMIFLVRVVKRRTWDSNDAVERFDLKRRRIYFKFSFEIEGQSLNIALKNY